ncbi:MAG: hypothetical protein CLLPBCKN_002094 [Chroococcidiopsis cubana SAG 39.79]|nr:hypothetical protein [Chroococcidiopsis cubana SAG 39.79]
MRLEMDGREILTIDKYLSMNKGKAAHHIKKSHHAL